MNTLHYRSIIPVPRNILTAYDIDDDDYYSEYDWSDEYDDYDIFTDDVLVISKDGVFLTDSESYYREVIIDEDYTLQDVLREDYVLCDNIKDEVIRENPEYFI